MRLCDVNAIVMGGEQLPKRGKQTRSETISSPIDWGHPLFYR